MKTILTVAKFTFIEVYRSKVMLSLIFMAMGLLLITYVASEFAFGAPAKVSLDVGLALLSLSNLGMAIFIGATLLNKEIEQKTLYMILSRPLSRASFLIGKTLGLSAILLINTFILVVLTVSVFIALGGQYEPLILWCAFFSFLESIIILLLAVYFSLITNTTMSVIYTIVVYIVGHALNDTIKIVFSKSSVIINAILQFSTIIIPHFYQLNLKDFVLYRQDISSQYLLTVVAYAMSYISFMYFMISFVFNKKNLD
jgi:ABC-type transport system involved in multi-copper enzyme maturation permease subunit